MMMIFNSVKTASSTKMTAIPFKIERVLLLMIVKFDSTYGLSYYMANKF